jgi:hypothetical protein
MSENGINTKLVVLLATLSLVTTTPVVHANEQSRMCEGPDGTDYIEVRCDHPSILTKSFSSSECSMRYKASGDTWIGYLSEPAHKNGSTYEFTVSEFMTFNPDIVIGESPPVLVEVDFPNWTVEVKGYINGVFRNCNKGY